MPNNRIFYACQAVAIGDFSPTTVTSPLTIAHGVQSVGINTTFNLEQAFELGQISIYENIEGLPDVEVTIEKVIDNKPLLFHLATATGVTLIQRTKNRCNVALGIFPDDNDFASGNAPVEVYMSGMYINSINYTFPTDGNFTESVTLVGNTKQWNTTATGVKSAHTAFSYGNDDPGYNAGGASGIMRRENLSMASSIMPLSIYGISTTGVGNNVSNNKPIAHIQNISISCDLGREDILELGNKEPYHRAENFPVEVTSEFEVIAVSGDFINVYANGDSTSEQPIKIALTNGMIFDLGKKNRLSSVNYTGGDAGGGNATIAYSFSTFNDLTVTSPF